MKKKKETRGGKRDGAGRKSPYDEETKIVQVTVPKSRIPEFKESIKPILKEYEHAKD